MIGGDCLDTLFSMLSVVIGIVAIVIELINIFFDNHKLYSYGNIFITISIFSVISFGVMTKNLIGGIGISFLFVLGILMVRGINKAIRKLIRKHVSVKHTNKELPLKHIEKLNSNENPINQIEKDSVINEDIYINSSSNEPINRYVKPVIHKLRRNLYDYVVLDIETTGLNKIDDRITQISAIKFKNDKEIDRLDQLLNPQKEIPEDIQYLTHITNEMVKDKPTFSDFNSKLSTFIGQFPIVGHNVKFDINFLIQNEIDLKDIYYEDTLPLSQRKLPDLKNHKLVTLKKFFGINNISHNALNDCETTAVVYQCLRDDHLKKSIVDTQITQSHRFDGLRFCITGQFMEMTRDEIKKLINIHGGKVTGSVSGLTDYLIKGKQVSKNLIDGIHSSSELKAMELSKNGGKIKIIDLNDLQHMIGDE